MDAAAVLERLTTLGVTVTPTPRGTLWLEPASKIPPDLVEAVRQNKPAIVVLLQSRSAGNVKQPDYWQKYPGDRPTDTELKEIQALVQDKGVCLLYSHVLKDFIAFVKDESYLKGVPPGFVPYTDDELWHLFGGTNSPSVAKLRLIHAAKKTAGGVVTSHDPEGKSK